MDQFPQIAGDEHIRLADLEWLDLSELIRMDDEWRRTLATISRLHLGVNALLALVVIGYDWMGRGSPTSPVEIGAMLGIGLCIAGMAYFVWVSQTGPSGILPNLRFVVFLSILAVTLMVYLLRDLQGDYYLLYFLPLVSAAGYLGFSGGLVAGVASALAYALVFSASPVSFAPDSISALILRTLIFVLVASLFGLIAERHLSLLTALRASHTQAIQLAITDTKSGLYNASFLQSRLSGEISRAERSKTPLAFLVVDVDGMDQINREHGYSSGDAVLKSLGAIIQKQLRLSDIPSRWGVDEFGVLLYDSDAQGAEAVAARIAGDVSREAFADPNTGRPFAVSVSVGIAVYPVHTQDKSGTQLVDRAYQAMQRAKFDHSIAIWE
ncbi:MAG: GGDEF domain-containing protein [Acidobacteriota bacterium]